jgi:hypothetical protein
VDEIAEAAADTSLATVEPTTRFAEVGDRAELAIDRPSCVPSRVEGIASRLRVFFVFETSIDVAD